MTRFAAVLVPAVVVWSCGVQPDAAAETEVGVSSAAMTDCNGLDPNGLGANGLDHNGLDHNGLDHNGLDHNGLDSNGLDNNGLVLGTPGIGTSTFNSWFDSNPTLNASVMKYLVRCSHSATQGVSYSHNGIVYNWPGKFGLAPGWAANQVPTLSEQRWVSACLLAHVNAKAQSVTVSFRAPNAPNQAPFALQAGESTYYIRHEGAFWGNLFSSTEGKYVVGDYNAQTGMYMYNYASGRACASGGNPCGMNQVLGGFSGNCTGSGASCGGYNEVVNTYIPRWCGDGICDSGFETKSTCAADCNLL